MSCADAGVAIATPTLVTLDVLNLPPWNWHLHNSPGEVRWAHIIPIFESHTHEL